MKFYKRTFTIDLYSEKPISAKVTVEQMKQAIAMRECIEFVKSVPQEEVKGSDMANILLANKINPAVFGIDDKGKNVYED